MCRYRRILTRLLVVATVLLLSIVVLAEATRLLGIGVVLTVGLLVSTIGLLLAVLRVSLLGIASILLVWLSGDEGRGSRRERGGAGLE